MRFGSTSILLVLALLLLADGATAAKCAIFVTDEYKMAVNGARIYLDDSPQPIGTTSYNAGFGGNCWIGNLDLNGSHKLSARWARAKPNLVSYEGSAMVEFAGDPEMRITIATKRL